MRLGNGTDYDIYFEYVPLNFPNYIILGECICAPHVTGTDDNPCSKCEENTFGYDPITGCQECDCAVEGTMNGNMSCDLLSGAC